MDITNIPLEKLVNAPYLFNGAIFKYKVENYMAYRANWDTWKCKLYITRMNKDWQPTGANWEIKIPILNHLFEDPRFIIIDDKPYLAVSQINLKTNCQFQGLVELTENLHYKGYKKLNYQDNWTIEERQNATKKANEHFFNFQTPMTFEKNWCFLNNQKNPTFIYKTQPVTIIAEFENDILIKEQGDSRLFNWPFGEIRGGASAIEIDGIFYHFFHSSAKADPFSNTEEYGIGRVYYLGCYTFKRNAEKFELLSQTRIPLVMGDYTEEVVLWGNASVFPCGVVYEEKQFKLSYGWMDKSLKLLTITKKELNSLLTPLRKPVYLEEGFNSNKGN